MSVNKKPALVVMAAGMGSRYGGLKQIDPVDEQGHIIMDFSVYDAVRAGFGKVIFIIKRENEQDFRKAIGDRIQEKIPVEYVFQELQNLPEGFTVPEGRVKPWGTAHAVLSCIDVIDTPFAVINADDYYGSHAFALAAEYLANHTDEEGLYRYMMVGYRLENTLTENGHVSRGICTLDAEDRLVDIVERTHIEPGQDEAVYTEDDGKTCHPIPFDATVSMNMWGFTPGFLQELKKGFPAFLSENLEKNPLKCEYYLPYAVDVLLKDRKCTVQVLKSPDRWFGVTYKEDKPQVVAKIKELKKAGLYPEEF